MTTITPTRTRRPLRLELLSLPLFFAAALHAAGAVAASSADNGKKSKQAVDRVLAIYLPPAIIGERILIPRMGTSFTPGKALEQAALTVGNSYFRSAASFSVKSDKPFNLVLVTHFTWESKDDLSVLTVKYKLLDSAGGTVFEGQKKDDVKTQKLLLENRFFAVSLGVMKDVLGDDALLAKATDAQTHSDAVLAASFDRKVLVDREKPTKTGTGFFINDHGQFMTAAHVVHDCPVVEVKIDGKAVNATPVAESVLLDLAVADTGTVSPHSIPLRAGTAFDLGEGVVVYQAVARKPTPDAHSATDMTLAAVVAVSCYE